MIWLARRSLIKARQEGFQAAMEIFGGEVSVPQARLIPNLRSPYDVAAVFDA